MTLPLAPQGVFLTVQGEGRLLGQPQVFIRLAGCPVGCPECPTLDEFLTDADLQPVRAGDVAVGDTLLGTGRRGVIAAHGPYRTVRVLSVAHRPSPCVRVEFDNGRSVVVSAEHAFSLHPHGRFRRSNRLRVGDVVRHIDFGMGQETSEDEYARGYLAGAADGDGSFHNKLPTTAGNPVRHFVIAKLDQPLMDRFAEFAARFGFPLNPGTHSSTNQCRMPCLRLSRTELVLRFEQMCLRDGNSDSFWRGYLAGIYDTDGSTDGAVFRVAQIKPRQRERIAKCMRALGLPFVEEEKGYRVTGGALTYRRMLAEIRPALRRKVDPLVYQEHRHSGSTRVVAVEPVGVREVASIKTDAGTYMVGGFLSRNCDTNYTVAERATVNDIVRRVIAAAPTGVRWVWLTGGEPTIHDIDPLVAALHLAGFRVALATAGVKAVRRGQYVNANEGMPPCPHGVDFLSVSPHRLDETWVQRRGEQVNVVPGLNGLRLDDVTMLDSVGAFDGFADKFLTPMWYGPGDRMEKVKECVEWVYAHPGWRLGVQAHKTWSLA